MPLKTGFSGWALASSVRTVSDIPGTRLRASGIRSPVPSVLTLFAAVGNLDAASGNPWYYKTAGPFSISNYADGSYGVLLALHFFSTLKWGSMSLGITPVMSFKAKSPEGREIEIDFAAFWRSRAPEGKVELIIGECKMYGKFENADFESMGYLAQAFEKQKPVLVFSTLRESLEAEEKEKNFLLGQNQSGDDFNRTGTFPKR